MIPAYTTKQLSERFFQITDPTGVFCFLALGDKEAVLIDTGIGFKGLKERAAEMTALPLQVILTHGHGDHAGGAAAFERVWLHPADFEVVKAHGMDMRTGYAKMSLPPGTEISIDDFVPEPKGDFLPLRDGQIFDLGGLHLRTILVPGHTRGCCSILFEEERSILFGDACNANTLVMDGFSASIAEYLESLRQLKSFDGSYDRVYYSHGPQPQGPSALEDNIELCQRILSGMDDAVPVDFLGMQGFRAAADDGHFGRLDGKYGNIVYSDLTAGRQR